MATKKSTAIAKTKDNRPETGRGGKRNFPSCLPDLSSDEDRALVSQLLTEVLVEYRQPKVKSDEELKERISMERAIYELHREVSHAHCNRRISCCVFGTGA